LSKSNKLIIHLLKFDVSLIHLTEIAMPVLDVVNKFGGQTSLSRLIGINQSAVAYWVKRGLIPTKWHSILLELAIRHGVLLAASDLMAAPGALGTGLPVGTFVAPGEASASLALTQSASAVSQFLFYASPDGTIKVQVIVGSETVWVSQKGMAEIFDVTVSTVSEHLQNIFSSGELDPSTTIRNFRTVVDSGNDYNINFYNLDATISVGYRVSSYQATQFRKWATSILREYLIKGFAMDDDRLKQGNRLFDKDYFDELLDRIRAIRASEKQFYRKVTDLYADCSVDYDSHAPITKHFYAHVQDKLHYAVHGHTSSELISERANAKLPHMGLQTFEGRRVRKSDTTVGKNYLNKHEADELNRLVNMYLDFAENLVRRNRLTGTPIKMQDWTEKLDSFLSFNGFPVLAGYGKVRRDAAELRALAEYEAFCTLQDQQSKPDFGAIAEEIRTTRKLPKSSS
jgi:hypothetical protein